MPTFTDTLKTWHDDRPKPSIEFSPPETDAEPVEMDAAGRERQAMKDWVRKEIAMAAAGKSEADRAKGNP